jgi:hypothetical protein
MCMGYNRALITLHYSPSSPNAAATTVLKHVIAQALPYATLSQNKSKKKEE